jgi:hypothetical protein
LFAACSLACGAADCAPARRPDPASAAQTPELPSSQPPATQVASEAADAAQRQDAPVLDASPGRDVEKQLAVAIAHAENALKGARLADVQNELGQVQNCLVGPGGEGFRPDLPNPCADFGTGLIGPPSSFDQLGPIATGPLEKALAASRAGAASKNLADVREKAFSVERHLAVFHALQEAKEFGMSGLLNDRCDTSVADGGTDDGRGAIREGRVSVQGRLPAEAVKNVVRGSFSTLLSTYRAHLRRVPSLTGHVAVKFVIDRSGAVSTVADDGSDLPDQGVVACALQAFGHLKFPQPDGGIVLVRYQVALTPAP